MTPQERIEFLAESYERRKQARRGTNVSYLSDEQIEDLLNKGYRLYVFDTDKYDTTYHLAQQTKDTLRELGCFARVVVNPSYKIKGTQTYSVYYKPKKKKRTR